MPSLHASLGAELPTNEKKKQEWAKKAKPRQRVSSGFTAVLPFCRRLRAGADAESAS
jgi:hypothetical protein